MNIEPIWRLRRGASPVVATAIHDGHALREELAPYLALDEAGRLREEDPWTGLWTSVAPNRVIGLRSRFEVDLNRPREQAVYQKPEDAWGLSVWNRDLPEDLVARSLTEYDAFYQALDYLYRDMARRYGAFVVFDLHTYNHRREGPDGPVADESANPQVNIGTRSVANRARFGSLIERFQEDLRTFDFPGGQLDVRENVKFFGAQHPRWAHANYPNEACVLAIEFKKFFMDEWSSAPDPSLVAAIRDALESTIPGVLEELSRLPVALT